MIFTKAELMYLIALVKEKKETGEYYGVKKQYMRRQEKVLKLLEANLEEKFQREFERGF